MLYDANGNLIRSPSTRSTGPVYQELAPVGGGRDITRPYVDDLGILQPLDELLANRETTIKGYKRILRDPQVISTFQQRRLAITSREYEVTPGGTRRADKKAADWLREMMDGVGWERVADKMLFGTFYGYAVGELLYARDGQYVAVDKIRVRDRERFGFGPDFGLRMFTTSNQVEGEAMPGEKFWVFSTGSDHDDDPYGLGLAHYLYWPVFFKRNGKAAWLKNLERWAQPVPHGKYPPGTPPHEQQKLLMALHAIQHDAGVITPEGFEVALLEATRAGTPDYNVLEGNENDAISKVVLTQTMTTDAKSTGLGSTQADVQDEASERVQRSDAKLLTGSFCEDGAFGPGPLCWLTRWNHPNAAMPKIEYVFDEPEDENQMAERDQKLYQSGWQRTNESQEDAYGEGWVRREAQPVDELVPSVPEAGVTDKTIGRGAVELAEEAERYDPSETPDVLTERALAEADVDAMMEPVEELLASATSLEQVRDGLFALFGEMDASAFQAVLARALQTSELAGRYEIDQEDGD
ncbi:MAG: DUF935 family protein [Bacteroidota bacterium]